MRDMLANQDTDMKDICTVKTTAEVKADQAKNSSEDKMELEGGSAQVYDKKTKRDANGQYPPWMNQRAMRKQQQKNKKMKKKKGKKASAW
nr:hypothetical protein BaRGS_002019 [Batillaria attramentaria]